jgi:hypothetical protein
MANSKAQFTGKYATEAYDIVALARLFQRSAYGLILIQLGWIAFLFCLLKLPVANARKLSLPSIQFRPLRFAAWPVEVWWIWMVGAILIAAYWVLRSHGFLLKRVTRVAGLFVISLLAILAAALLFLANLVLSLIWFIFGMSWRIKKLQDRERLRRLDAIRSKHALVKAPITDAEAEKEMEADLRRKYPEGKFPKLDDALFAATITSQDPTDKLRLGDAAVFLLHFTFLNPEASIAIAPFGAFPELADPSASRDGAEIFGVAVERLNARARLGNWPEVRFQWLPAHWSISTRGWRRWRRFLLGADALIWGHYHIEGDVDTIWARFEICR